MRGAGAVPNGDAMHVLVTGGAGFIGSHLCDQLLQRGHAVTCLDNLSTGTLENVRALLNHPRFSLIEQDVTEPLHIRGPLQRIYNLACPASPPHYQSDPVATMRTCVIGAINVLELARQKGACVLQASTSEVYGDPEVHPQPEDYRGCVNPIGPRACYDEGKRSSETLFFDYHRTRGVAIKVARIFNTYGPRMLEDDGRVVSNFISQALRGAPITVYGDGTQTRSFCYIDDMIDGLERLMESPIAVTGPCNLGNPCEVSVGDIAARIIAHTASHSRIVYKPLPQDDPRRRQPSIDAARRLLGWQPRVALEEGLRRTVDDFALRLCAQPALLGRQAAEAPAAVPRLRPRKSVAPSAAQNTVQSIG